MRLTEDILLAHFETRSLAELLKIREQTQNVIFGLTESMSILSQSVRFSPEAGIVLKAVDQAIAARNAGVDATDVISLRPAMGHAVRFSGRYLTAP